MKHLFLLVTMLLTTSAFAQTTETKPLPKSWHTLGNPMFEAFQDITVKHSGQASASIRAKESATGKIGGTYLDQVISAKNYLGKRVRLSGYIKTQNAELGSGFWMRVDGDEGKILSFDNMADRFVKGTTDWRKYEVVLDVPADALQIRVGVIHNGKGQIWIDDLKLEVVGQDVASTNMKFTPEQKQAMTEEREKRKRDNSEQYQKQVEGIRNLFKTGNSELINADFEQS